MPATRGHIPHLLVGALAVLLMAGGLALEATLQREITRARDALPHALARVPAAPDEDQESRRALAIAIRRQIGAGEYGSAADALARRAEAFPTADGRALAAKGARAAGRFDVAARHQTLAGRLSPGDEDAQALGERALDLALLGRLRRPAQVLGLLAFAFLSILVVRRARRRGQRRRREAWLDALRARMTLTIDGQGAADGGFTLIGPRTSSLAIDLFFTRRGAPRRAPRSGPTLAIVLSHAGENRSVRLTPRRNFRDDAVRIRLRDETLARVLAVEGLWRLQARLDGRLVAETDLRVLECERAGLSRRRAYA